MGVIQHCKRAVRAARAFVQSETVSYDGAIIPAAHLRFGGRNFSSDRNFAESGKKEAKRLVKRCGLTSSSSVLEIGCGPGRLPLGILQTIGPIRSYTGIDVSRVPIDWCRRHISTSYPSFWFIHIDVHNPRYNKGGSLKQKETALPVEDQSIDIIYLYSVFSHVLEEDVRSYLREFKRVLRLSGKIFLTAFVEDGVEPVSENPRGYGPEDWKGPLHCVRYESAYFQNIIEGHGFVITRIDRGTETDGQSGIYVQRAVA